MKSSSGYFLQQDTSLCYMQTLQFYSLKVDIFKLQAYECYGCGSLGHYFPRYFSFSNN